jgi:hypothetical protein
MLESMKRVCLLSSVTALLLCTLTAQAQNPAQERGYWRAASTTARSITGDITLADEKLTINFSTTPISRIRALEPAEVSAVFDTDSSAKGTGSLYRLNIPSEKKFLRKNNLCGAENVQWMVAYAAGGSLQLAFFSGDKPPVFTFDAIRNSTDLCGTYSYVK